MSLRWARYVTGEEDHAGRLDRGEQGSEARRHLDAVEADDEKLTDVCSEISDSLEWH
jgi:hypothetical protein